MRSEPRRRSPEQLSRASDAATRLANLTLRPELEQLRRRSSQNLVDFLRIDLDLGRLFAQMAHMQKIQRHSENYERIRGLTERTLTTVRQFENRIVDQEARKEIRQRANELERMVDAL